jgi:hypothetical protein
MDITDWISITIAGLSLVLSSLTAYLTLLRKAKAVVRARRRVILTQVEGVPCLVIDCTLYNPGTRGVYIEDLMLQLRHSGSGSKFSFGPILTRDTYSVFQDFRRQDFEPFKSISVDSQKGIERAVVFKPMFTKFTPSAGVFDIELLSSSDRQDGWDRASVCFSIELDQEDVEEWSSPIGTNRQIEAREIGAKRRKLLESLP